MQTYRCASRHCVLTRRLPEASLTGSTGFAPLGRHPLKSHAAARQRQSQLLCSACGTGKGVPASGPKAGLVGLKRFQQDALPGTYFGPDQHYGKDLEVRFHIGPDDQLSIQVPIGSNLLQAGELSGAIKINRDFCFEGSCELCQLEVEGGALELGPKAQLGSQELVRGCLTAVPCRANGTLCVKVLSEESVWSEGVL